MVVCIPESHSLHYELGLNGSADSPMHLAHQRLQAGEEESSECWNCNCESMGKKMKYTSFSSPNISHDLREICKTEMQARVAPVASLSWVNSLVPGICDCDFKWVNFKDNLMIVILSIQGKNTLERMPEDLIDGKSTLVQVMAWCRQATSHYLDQCWPRCGITIGHN